MQRTIPTVSLHTLFRPPTSVIYPPFKKGRYLEEYFYDYVLSHTFPEKTSVTYIPAFWTNLQIDPMFVSKRLVYQKLLNESLSKYPTDTLFFTVVQHDDGVLLNLPPNTYVFGACSGNLPIPLIYEDTTSRLQNQEKTTKTQLATFVGTITHPIRKEMLEPLKPHNDVVAHVQTSWTNSVNNTNADLFINECLKSRFVLAPRGYGRSSFRFFEAMELGSVPVYIWDDKKWLPYLHYLNYDKFAIVIHSSELSTLYGKMISITDEKYNEMLKESKKVKEWFTLDGMCKYILSVVLVTQSVLGNMVE